MPFTGSAILQVEQAIFFVLFWEGVSIADRVVRFALERRNRQSMATKATHPKLECGSDHRQWSEECEIKFAHTAAAWAVRENSWQGLLQVPRTRCGEHALTVTQFLAANLYLKPLDNSVSYLSSIQI